MKARNLTSVFFAAFIMASCSDRGQEMEEKVTQMQRQLDEAQKQLQAANQALVSRAPAAATETSTASASTGGLPSRDAIEQSYATTVAAFRKELDSNLKDFRVESCTTHSVQMPTEFFPFTSQLSLALVSNDGKNFTTDIPVKADVTGKWIFPTVTEVTQRIETVNRAASTATAPSSRSTAQSQPTAGRPAPYMKVDGTFVIQWPDSNSPRPATRAPAPVESAPSPVAQAPAPPPPRPQPTPAQSSQPGANPVMPVDRDVQIQFPSPP